jgi:hypothetical protein
LATAGLCRVFGKGTPSGGLGRIDGRKHVLKYDFNLEFRIMNGVLGVFCSKRYVANAPTRLPRTGRGRDRLSACASRLKRRHCSQRHSDSDANQGLAQSKNGGSAFGLQCWRRLSLLANRLHHVALSVNRIDGLRFGQFLPKTQVCVGSTGRCPVLKYSALSGLKSVPTSRDALTTVH